MSRAGAKQLKKASCGTGFPKVVAADLLGFLAPVSSSKVPRPCAKACRPTSSSLIHRHDFFGCTSACRCWSGLSGEGRVSCRRRVRLWTCGAALLTACAPPGWAWDPGAGAGFTVRPGVPPRHIRRAAGAAARARRVLCGPWWFWPRLRFRG